MINKWFTDDKLRKKMKGYTTVHNRTRYTALTWYDYNYYLIMLLKAFFAINLKPFLIKFQP